MLVNENRELKAVVGKRIVSAVSSLKNFSIVLEDQLGIRIDAVDGPSGPALSITTPPSSDLPHTKEAVCSVDWSWIYNTSIKAVKVDSARVTFDLDSAGPLAVSASAWQGSAFLAFQPFKPPVK